MALNDLLVFEDVLASHGMRPWWETLRSVTILVLIGSVVIFFSPNSRAISCTALKNNHTECFSTNADYVYDKCFLLGNWVLRSLPWIGTVASALAFLSNNFWLYMPSVKRAVQEVYRFVEHFLEQKKGYSAMLSERPVPVNEQEPNFVPGSDKESLKFLAYAINIFVIYRYRNLVSLMFSLTYGAGCTYFLWASVARASNEYACTIGTGDVSCKFTCLYIHLTTYRLFLTLNLLASYVQLVVFVWQLIRGEVRAGKAENRSLRGVDLLGDLMDMENDEMAKLKHDLWEKVENHFAPPSEQSQPANDSHVTSLV